MFKTWEKSLLSVHQRIRLSIIQTVRLSTCHCLLQTHQKSPVIMGRKHSKFPARKPSKITNHQYIIRYAFWCTRPCIVCTTHPYIMHFVCRCTSPCIVHTTRPYIVRYVCLCTCASSIPSVLPYDDKRQEFLDGFPSTNYGEKNMSKIMVKFTHDVTLTLQQAKFLEETPDR